MELPTEAQWEYAARGGTVHPFVYGTEPETLEGAANICDQRAAEAGAPKGWTFAEWNDGYATTAPVGTYRPNPFGLHDVIGNVWEWTLDLFGSYELPVREGDGMRVVEASVHRIMRGFDYTSRGYSARVSRRGDMIPESKDRIGVRPVRKVLPPVDVIQYGTRAAPSPDL